MKFEIISTYFRELGETSQYTYDKEDVDRIREVLLPYCTEDNGVLYIEITYISELQSIQESLNKVYKDLDNDYVCSKIEFIIDFENMRIEIYDYYRE